MAMRKASKVKRSPMVKLPSKMAPANRSANNAGKKMSYSPKKK